MNAATSILTPVRRSDASKCAAQHFGPWAIEPRWFKQASEAIRAGSWKPEKRADDGMDDDYEEDGKGYTITDGVAIIRLEGQMTKRGSSYGGCSTVQARSALRMAAEDYGVRAILLHICSPGGTVSGTADLADDVLAVRGGQFGIAKRVDAFIADMGCSAAYWVASQCEQITANVTAIVGSIGTYTVLADDTAYSDEVGFKYTVISTGPYKGLGADGKVSDTLIADVQREVNELNAPFLAAVESGRGRKIANIAAVSDGRAYVGEQAKQMGLIDDVSTLDAAVVALSGGRLTPTRQTQPSSTPPNVAGKKVSMTVTEQVKAIAAEHPEAIAPFIEQGRKAATADTTRAEVARMSELEAACPGRPALAISLFKAGKTAEDAKVTVAALEAESASAKAAADAHAAALAEKDKEIERLRFEAGGRKPVSGSAPAAAPKSGNSHADTAKAEWASNADDCNKKFSSEANYVSIRTAELAGKHRNHAR